MLGCQIFMSDLYWCNYMYFLPLKIIEISRYDIKTLICLIKNNQYGDV